MSLQSRHKYRSQWNIFYQHLRNCMPSKVRATGSKAVKTKQKLALPSISNPPQKHRVVNTLIKSTGHTGACPDENFHFRSL